MPRAVAWLKSTSRFAWRGLIAGPRLFFNPVVVKELRVSSRLKRTYLLRSGYLAVLVAILFLMWLSLADMVAYDTGAGSTAQALSHQSRASEQLSLVLVWIQLLGLAFLAPALTASAIGDEIEARSLDVLLVTPLSSAQIVLGKLISRMAHVLLLVALAAPFLLVLRLYGGLGADVLWRVEVLSLTTALFGASVGLLVSTVEKRSWRATSVAYTMLFGWWLVVPLMAASATAWFIDRTGIVLPHLSSDMGSNFVAISLPINPVACMILMTEELQVGALGGADRAWQAVNVTNLIVTAAMLVPAIVSLRRRARIIGGDKPVSRWRRWLGASPTPAATAPESELPLPVVSARPVLWRELRYGLFDSRAKRYVALAALLLGWIWVNWTVEPWTDDGRWLHVPIIYIGLTLHLLLIAQYASASIAHERTARTWEVLITSPLTPAQILWGKALGTLRRTAGPVLVVLAHLLIYTIFDDLPWRMIVQLTVLFAGWSLLVAAVGVAFSLRCNRAVTASAATLFVFLSAWLGMPMLMGSLIGIMGWGGVGDELIGLVLQHNPYYWFSIATQGLTEWRWNPQRYVEYELLFPEATVSWQTATVLITASAAAAAALGTLILIWATGAFNRLTGRSS